MIHCHCTAVLSKGSKFYMWQQVGFYNSNNTFRYMYYVLFFVVGAGFYCENFTYLKVAFFSIIVHVGAGFYCEFFYLLESSTYSTHFGTPN